MKNKDIIVSALAFFTVISVFVVVAWQQHIHAQDCLTAKQHAVTLRGCE